MAENIPSPAYMEASKLYMDTIKARTAKAGRESYKRNFKAIRDNGWEVLEKELGAQLEGETLSSEIRETIIQRAQEVAKQIATNTSSFGQRMGSPRTGRDIRGIE